MKIEFFKKITFVMICLTVLAVFTTSCSKDDDDPVKHTLKFEISGTYTGDLKANLIFAGEDSADVETADITKLTWTKEVEVTGAYNMSMSAMTWNKSGKKGEKITMKLYADGKEVKSSTTTADSDGDIASGIISYTGGN